MTNLKVIRILDLILSSVILIFISPLFFIIFTICFFETGRPIFIQNRIGKNEKIFKILKFRTMKIDTPQLASHLVNHRSLTKFGKLIRLLKLDELPQLINVIKGEMSLVGPRPCLLNQKELIIERKKNRIFSVSPGITGLAQINGIDMSNPIKLTFYDRKMIANFNLNKYFKYLLLTTFGKGLGDKVNFKY